MFDSKTGDLKTQYTNWKSQEQDSPPTHKEVAHSGGGTSHPPRSQCFFIESGTYNSRLRCSKSQMPPTSSFTLRKLIGLRIQPSNCARVISSALDSGREAETAKIGTRL